LVSKIAPSLISTDRIRVLDLEYQFLPEGDTLDHLMNAIVKWKAGRGNGPDRIIMSSNLYYEILSIPQVNRSWQLRGSRRPRPILSIFGIKVEMSPLIRNRGYVLR